MRTDEAAVQVMREQGAKIAWSGNPDLIHEIAERAGYKRAHPLNVIGAVMSNLGKSPMFKRAGYIKHMGHKYPVYEVAATTGAAR